MHPTLRTRLCELAEIDVPIVQTGMGWVAGPRLVAATSNAGALGILAAATMDLAEMEKAIAEVKSRTSHQKRQKLKTVASTANKLLETTRNVSDFKMGSFAMLSGQS